jgi:NAD(P)-dependent dehydrogenase (short-subunit alcohol dehydrogenase family)
VPAVLSLAQRFGARGLRVVGVTRSGENDEERRDVEAAAKEEKMTYPTLLDPSGAWWDAANVGVAPTFLVIAKDGRLAYRHTGKLTEGSEGFTKLVAAIEQSL